MDSPIPEILIREGTLTDIGYVADIHCQIYTVEYQFLPMFHSLVFNSLSQYIKDEMPGKIWIIEVNGKRAGTISLVKSSQNDYHQIRWFAVDTRFRGLGLGNKLLQHLMQYANSKNIDKLFLWTVKILEGARTLYKRFGFTLQETKINNTWTKEEILEEKWIYTGSNNSIS
ncbi:hypothetical protein DLAC_08831 [Tieghemostelium lacteum]|uniref:N-acetyltransferase domain-containing protein n=1 Tax=Tieghemostelium lacteum TaxID=361077 RepID=A0A151Z8E9_TIELA|nr:hypothetical protein DLAC_08831 [Tieghemostelium lacteum]|eukprot:KYQ90230.1 hypothetical protein DLAC_08831 [Tieghemostelium lacteum]